MAEIDTAHLGVVAHLFGRAVGNQMALVQHRDLLRDSEYHRHVVLGEQEGHRLKVGGLVEHREPWTLERLYGLPQTSQITRHVCIEGWSAIGQWSGVKFSDFLARVGADRRARYVAFRCADDYSTSIDMATALHPRTLLALRFRHAVLPRKYGFPMNLRVPIKLGFKNPKHIMAINVTNDFPGGFWEKYGYNWFSGL